MRLSRRGRQFGGGQLGRNAIMISTSALIIFILTLGYSNGQYNLSCYQCTRNKPELCPEENYLPCSPSKDRCVTHISKDSVNGYVLKRECGLGPCGFEDAMVNRGLGFDKCDTSKDEFFCVFCCRENGCNSGTTAVPVTVTALLSLAALHFNFFQNH